MIKNQPMIPGLEKVEVSNREYLSLKRESQDYIKKLKARVLTLEIEVFVLRTQLERSQDGQ